MSDEVDGIFGVGRKIVESTEAIRLNPNDAGTFTDPRDGKTYRTVKIGSQIWMAENLNYETPKSEWYNNDPAMGAKYGRLYTWKDAMKACPPGWHLPSDEEWTTLIVFVGGSSTDSIMARANRRARERGFSMGRGSRVGSDNFVDFVGGSSTVGKKLKSKSGWKGKRGNGTDEYGFSALPGGYGNSDGDFDGASSNGSWWSATDNGAYYACSRYMIYDDEGVNRGDDDKAYLFSVRCVQD